MYAALATSIQPIGFQDENLPLPKRVEVCKSLSVNVTKLAVQAKAARTVTCRKWSTERDGGLWGSRGEKWEWGLDDQIAGSLSYPEM